MTHLALFLHVFGAMTLFGSVLAAAIAALTDHRRAAFWALLLSLPDFVVMRGAGQWVYHRYGFTGHGDPTWISIGFDVADMGVIVLLLALAAAYWWRRRLCAGLSIVYLVMLAVAWMAMSGKWN